ncbi:hypothetical protein A6M21_09515 [Desulfotomaculum copahuensis]|uniref:Uncharacterized protein n=1 Tax=Desulfotomaculum copahuensis TaxID=1838280 RepID=A0A1B7LFG4_9FIRM|nr:hypothetical protein A6M21_09515 [Desulfotomaculum copahuensis]
MQHYYVKMATLEGGGRAGALERRGTAAKLRPPAFSFMSCVQKIMAIRQKPGNLQPRNTFAGRKKRPGFTHIDKQGGLVRNMGATGDRPPDLIRKRRK